MKKDRVLIMGAAGRDFHNFNVYFRDNKAYEVVAFTATQIPNIEGRVYPAGLAGPGYPDGIPIYPESKLTGLIKELNIDQVVFGYSDVSYDYVMHKASMVLAAGADFRLMGGKETMLRARVPVVSVCAVRTGCGKSQTSRRVSDILREMGKKVVVVRHPMPYGDLVRQACQRFATYDDLDKQQCTIEEREEYEPHLDRGMVVYAGVDYEQILRQAEQEADIVLWDGGNNDLPFYKPDLHIVVTDPHRAGHEVAYHPGEANLRLADVVIINKVDTGDLADITTVRNNVQRVNPQATLIEAASPIFVEDPEAIRGKEVLVVEDDTLVSVVLFGSRARGSSQPDSDFDLLIVAQSLPDEAGRRELALDIAEVGFDYGLPVQVVLASAEETDGAVNTGAPLMFEIHDAHQVIYDKDHFFHNLVKDFSGLLETWQVRKIKDRVWEVPGLAAARL